MTDRVESKRLDPGKVCTYPGRLFKSRRGVEARELDDPVWAAFAAARPLRVLPILLGKSPELVGKLNSVPRVMTRSGGLALDLSVD